MASPLLLALLLAHAGAWALNSTSGNKTQPTSHNPFEHRTFFQPDIGYGTVLVFTGAFICAGGGIGGGGVFIPTYLLALNLTAHWALPLSQVTILGVGFGSALFLLPRRHPTLPRRLIDMSAISMLEPATLLGTIPGVYLNIIMPSYLLTIFLALVLTATTWTTLRKGYLTFKEEQKVRSLNINEGATLIPKDSTQAVGSEASHDGLWKWWHWASLVATVAILAATEVGKVFLHCGTWQYWLVATSPVLLVGAIIFVVSLQPPKRPWIWPVGGCVAGLAAGWLGIGGGMVKSPLLIALRVTPQVAAATASFMILWTSTATTLEFFLLGRLDWRFALWYGVTGMVGSFLGQLVLARVVNHYGRQSFVALFVGTIIGLCSVAILITNILSIVSGSASMAFSGPCTVLGAD